MTLEQILSPAVMDWFQENGNLPKEQMIKEFDNWLVNNEEKNYSGDMHSFNHLCFAQFFAKSAYAKIYR